MGTLKEKFEELSAGIKASGKPAAAWFPKYTSTSLLNADNWWEALAVCEYALDTREDSIIQTHTAAHQSKGLCRI